MLVSCRDSKNVQDSSEYYKTFYTNGNIRWDIEKDTIASPRNITIVGGVHGNGFIVGNTELLRKVFEEHARRVGKKDFPVYVESLPFDYLWNPDVFIANQAYKFSEDSISVLRDRYVPYWVYDYTKHLRGIDVPESIRKNYEHFKQDKEFVDRVNYLALRMRLPGSSSKTEDLSSSDQQLISNIKSFCVPREQYLCSNMINFIEENSLVIVGRAHALKWCHMDSIPAFYTYLYPVYSGVNSNNELLECMQNMYYLNNFTKVNPVP